MFAGGWTSGVGCGAAFGTGGGPLSRRPAATVMGSKELRGVVTGRRVRTMSSTREMWKQVSVNRSDLWLLISINYSLISIIYGTV